jgi:hypothetical protein
LLGSGSLPALSSRDLIRLAWLGQDLQFPATGKGHPLSVI